MVAGDSVMKAARDWDLPRETATEQRELVEFTAELGFDTLVVTLVG